MSRNYRELAAQRLAEIAEKNLEVEVLKGEITSLKALYQEAKRTSEVHAQEITALNGDIASLQKDVHAAKKLATGHEEDLRATEGLKEAQRGLLKRIYWFLVNYPVEGNLAAVSARQGLLGDMQKMEKDDE